MGKSLIILTFAFFPLIASGQVEKGTIFINGSTGLSYSSVKNQTIKTISYSINTGYFLFNDFSLGVGLSHNSSHYKLEAWDPLDPNDPIFRNLIPDKLTATAWQIFSRYYINRAYFGAAYERTKYDFFYESGHLNYLKLQTGYAAFLNEFVSLEPSLNYFIGVDDQAKNYLAFNLGFGIYLKP